MATAGSEIGENSKSNIVTRKATEIWLIGQTSSTLNSTKLPSKKEVMALFFHYRQIMKQTIREASHSTANDVLEIWTKARIPTKLKTHIVEKVEGGFREWENLKKSKNKALKSAFLKKKEDDWKEVLKDLFDIAHADSLKMIKIDEDKEFLLAQREKGRRGKMGNVDLVLAKKEAAAERKKEEFRRKREREEEEIRTRNQKVLLVSSSESEDENQSQGQVEVNLGDKPSTSGIQQRRGRKNIIDQNLAASLDVAKLSDRKAAIVLTPTLKRLGLDPSEYNVNPASIRRQRIQCRKNISEGLKADFNAQVPLTIHWDGKLLEDIAGREKVDRLPILVSGKGVDQLLGVPKLSSGTGEAAASAVFDAAVEWQICDMVKCMSFDTTAVNTGSRNGACILLEQKMDKDMLWLACRHHILEIILEAVVLLSLGPSTGPDMLLFKRFKSSWTSIDHENYLTSASDDLAASSVADIAEEMIAFAEHQLREFQPRDDYRELLQLTIIFLGGIPVKGISFKAPAGLHRARWMAKAIYSLKIWIFRGEFKLTKREETGILKICLFTVRLYLRFWFQAPSATSAPRHDLELLKGIDKYKQQDDGVASIAMRKFLGHLWYLSEELVAFAFFDDEVPLETKRKMACALKNPGNENPMKRVTVDTAVIQQKQLEDFVTSNTRRFFTITGLPADFLDIDVIHWKDDEVYQYVRSTVRCMGVVNDIAERGVALMDEYNKIHTNDEEQKQFLLLVVKEHRKKYPDRKKSTLIK